MAIVSKLVSSGYRQIAAVAYLTLIQCPTYGRSTSNPVQLIVADTLPGNLETGVELAPGETVVAANIPDLGSGTYLYAKVAGAAVSGEVVTV